jgi:uncharacterized repeat protein (TIGR03833 family)
MNYKTTNGGRRRRNSKKRRENNNVVANVPRDECANYDNPSKNTTIGMVKPKSGEEVIVIIKPYNAHNCIRGTVADILTRKEQHTRGHKVRLTNGVVGRTLKIIQHSDRNSKTLKKKSRKKSKKKSKKKKPKKKSKK